MHDLAVIGLGALGVHVAAEAAARGLDVVGFDTHGPAHEHGATGGRTRIFRVVYTFGGDYLPALLRARDAWARLDERNPGAVRAHGGGLLIGRPDDPEVAAALASAREHDIPHEVLGAHELAARWPQHRLRDDDVAIADPQGALLLPQAITAAVAREAREHGASLHHHTTVTHVEPIAGGHELVTQDGERVRARRLLVAAGAWSPRFAPELADVVELRRAVLLWFATDDPAAHAPDRFPVGLRRSTGLRYSFFPQVDEHGIKINLHVPKAVVRHLDDVESVPEDYGQDLEPQLRETLPGIVRRTRVASFVESYTSDYRIVLDRIAGRDDAWLLAGGSGQAFKLAPVLAEHAVSRLLDEPPTLSLDGVVRRTTTTPTETVVGP